MWAFVSRPPIYEAVYEEKYGDAFVPYLYLFPALGGRSLLGEGLYRHHLSFLSQIAHCSAAI
jgi:hypothetical protein